MSCSSRQWSNDFLHFFRKGVFLRRLFFKGQSSIELLVILSVSLAAFAGVVFFANQKIGGFNSSVSETQLEQTVELLANASREVFVQGDGVEKIVVLRLPGGIDSESSRIENNSIIYSLSGRAFFKTLEFQLEGSLASKPGTNAVKISSLNQSITIEPVAFSPDKSSFFLRLNKGGSVQEFLVLKNHSQSLVSISMQKQLSSEDVSASFSPSSSFDLNAGSSETIQMLFSSKPTASGTYAGKITVNGSTAQGIDYFEIPLFFEVSGTGVLAVFPSEISSEFSPGTAGSRLLSLCNNSQAMLSNISFSRSTGQPGEWFSQLEPVDFLQPGCIDRTVDFFIPSNASGVYSGFLTFSDGFNVASVDLNLSVGGS